MPKLKVVRFVLLPDSGIAVIASRNVLASVLVALTCTTSVLAGPYSELIVFGDSLSDVGNVFQKTDEFPLIDAIPAPAYYEGRFSNGPVYAEQLATSLGLGPLTHSAAGGNNFAHGNAMTSGTGGVQSLIIDDVDDQIDDLLASRTVDPEALFVVFAGANDLFGGQTNVDLPVGNLINDIGRLITAGAENLLVGNLPLLGLTPRFNSNPAEAAAKNAVTENYNSALALELDMLESNNSGINLFRFDVAQLITDAVADPGAFGLVNVTDPAAPGLEFDTSDYDENLIVDNPETYLFWDEIHPTTTAHALLAELALDAVTYSADFDFNGQVDAYDLATWELAYGINAQADADDDQDSDGYDFLQWQQQFGSGVSGLVVATETIPEPSSLLLSLGLLSLGCLRHQERRT